MDFADRNRIFPPNAADSGDSRRRGVRIDPEIADRLRDAIREGHEGAREVLLRSMLVTGSPQTGQLLDGLDACRDRMLALVDAPLCATGSGLPSPDGPDEAEDAFPAILMHEVARLAGEASHAILKRWLRDRDPRTLAMAESCRERGRLLLDDARRIGEARHSRTVVLPLRRTHEAHRVN